MANEEESRVMQQLRLACEAEIQRISQGALYQMRGAEFIDRAAVGLWVQCDPVHQSMTENARDALAAQCVREARRLWDAMTKADKGEKP